MHHARLATCPRLRRALDVLQRAQGEISTLELSRQAGICAVNSVIAELLVDELEKLHAQASSLDGVAKGTVSFTTQDAKAVLEQVEIIAFGVGTIKSAIGEFRALVPEGGE